MKRILFVIPTMRIGGAEKALISLLNSTDQRRVSVDVFLFEHGGVLQKQIPDWVNILPEDIVTRAMTLELRTYWKDLLHNGKLGAAIVRLWMSIRSTIRGRLNMKPVSSWNTIKKHITPIKEEYDVAIGFLEGFADFYALDKSVAKKKIAWIHSDLGKQRLSSEDIETYNRFDSYVTITDACKETFATAINITSDRVSVISNIVSPEQILKLSEETTPEWRKDIAQILTVGRIEYQKGSDIGLEACKVLADMGIEYCWHFIGTGSLLDKLRKKASLYGLDDKCIFEGQKENPYPYMKNADIIVQPSRVEGKSIVLDEAKILGKAIVAADYPSVTDQIENGYTGIIAKTTPEDIADSIVRLLRNDELRRNIENNNIKTVSDLTKQELGKLYSLVEI